MNHTISGRDFQNLWFNATLVGETGINAALCGTWGCPVLLVTGDEASCREGKELLGQPLRDQGRYKNTNAAHALRYRSGVELLDSRTIVSRADTWWDAWTQLYF